MSQVLDPDETHVPARVVRVMRGGRLRETLVVAKVTFDLRPGTSPVAATQEALVLEAETYGPRSNSLRRIQEVAPAKARSDVVVVGSAFAPGSPDKAFEARVQIGAVEKAILVRPPRFLEKDGTLSIDPCERATPLSYELARGGDHTWNPFGVDGVTADDSGRIPLPRIEALAEHGAPSEPIGLGPIPLLAEWPLRAVSKNPEGALELAREGDDASPNAAPLEQQLDGPIPEGISIALVNLLPSHPRFSSKLERVRPVAHVPGAGSVALVADTLLVDTDLGVCLVIYRASLGQAHVDAWVDPRIELRRDAPQGPLVPQPTAEFDAFELEQHTVDTPFMPAQRAVQRQDTMELEGLDGADLDAPPSPPVGLPPAPPSSTGDAYGPPAFSFGGIEVPPPPPSFSQSDAALSGAPRAPTSSGARRAPAPSGAPQVPATPAPFPVAAPLVLEKPTYLAKSDAVTAARGPSLPAARDGATATPKGALDASNDAVDANPRSGAAPAAKLKLVPRAMNAPREAPETIELLWFAPEVVPGLRAAPALADAFPENMESERGASAADLSRDVRRALLFAKPATAPQKEVVISASDKRSGLYRTQLLLVVGEIAAAFDARLTLEAMLGATEMLLPGEKGLRTLTEAARKLLETEWVTTPLLDQAAQSLRDATMKLRDPNSALVEPTVERLLLEKRAYRTRLVFGGEHLRFTWHDEGRPGIPVYLPGELKDRLPMYPKLAVRALVEVRPRQDAFESHAAALLLRAIGRRLGQSAS